MLCSFVSAADKIWDNCHTTLPGGTGKNQIGYAIDNTWFQAFDIDGTFNGTTNITKIEAGIYKIGAPTGNVYAEVWNKTGANTRVRIDGCNSTNVLDIATVTDNRANTVTFNFTFAECVPGAGTNVTITISPDFTHDTSNHGAMPRDDGGVCANLHYGSGTNAEYNSGVYQAGSNSIEKWWIVWYDDAKLPPPPAADNTSSIDIKFYNKTAANKTIFDEGENFFGRINWTNDYNNQSINDTFGSCELSYEMGIEEIEGLEKDITFCVGGTCDYSTLQENFTYTNSNVTQNLTHDFIIIQDLCRESGNKDLDLLIGCGGQIDLISILSSQMPLCPVTIDHIEDLETLCTNQTMINLTISTTEVGLTKAKQYHEIEIDRQYVNFTQQLTYNNATKEWLNFTSTEYYTHGNFYVHGQCFNSNDINLNINTTETVTITNLPPQVIFNGVTTILGFTPAASPLIIEYAAEQWNWSGVVEDDDLLHFNVSWYNTTGSLLLNYTFLTNTTELTTPDGMFVEFAGNPYTINVTAIDSVGGVTGTTVLSSPFNVTDTQPPSSNPGFINFTIENGTLHMWNETFTDQYLWSFTFLCNDTFNDSVSGIAASSYNWFNSTIITSDTNCNATIWDGHTSKLKKLNTDGMIIKDVQSNTLEFDGIKFKTNQKVKNITYIINYDSVSFCFETDIQENDLEFVIPDECVKAPNSPWLGHIICKKDGEWKYAIDLESDEDYPISFFGGEVIVDTSKAKSNKKCFNSIVELNKKTYIQGITVFFPHVDTLQVGVCPTDTAGVLTLWLIVIIAILFILLGFVKGGVFGVFGAIMLAVTSWYIAGCVAFFAFILALVSVFLFIYFTVISPYGIDNNTFK